MGQRLAGADHNGRVKVEIPVALALDTLISSKKPPD